jgi:16S rRNA (cytidine1402-2'-O)-methyltransferase
MELGEFCYLTLPIGNLNDISINVLEALKSGDLFFVEDTRSFKNLLGLYGISLSGKVIKSFHDQSSEKTSEEIYSFIKNGRSIYYCSEAGSPVISDPGVSLIKSLEAFNDKIQVKSHGGVCSIITALEVSKVPFSKFMFHGFFPRDNNSRKKVLDLSRKISKTHVFFESPHRVHKSLKVILECNSRPDELFICRELTKKFQEVIKINKSDDLSKLDEVKEKGEFVLILNYHNNAGDLDRNEDLVALAEQIISGNTKPRTLAKLLSKITNRSAKEIYLALEKN